MITPGAGMPMAIELAIQEAVVIGLHALASDIRSIDELTHRDDELRGNTAAEWHRELRAALLDALDTSSHGYVEVLLNYPNGKARLPAISIVEESGGENQSEQVVGMVLRESDALVGPNQELWATREIGGGETTTLEIGTWSTSPELSLLIRAAVRWALRNQQEALIARGVHEISISTSGMAPNPDLEPRVMWVPIITASVNWTLRQSIRKRVPNRVTIRPGTFST